MIRWVRDLGVMSPKSEVNIGLILLSKSGYEFMSVRRSWKASQYGQQTSGLSITYIYAQRLNGVSSPLGDQD